MTVDETRKFVEMQEDLSTVKTDVREIKSALLGDGYLSTGLVGELKKQDELIRQQGDRLTKLEGMMKKIIALAVGAGAGLTFGLKYLLEYLKSL